MYTGEFTQDVIDKLDMAVEGRAAESWTRAALATVTRVRAERAAGVAGTPWAPSADTRHRVRSYIRQYGL